MSSLFQTNRPHTLYASLLLLLAALAFGGASRLEVGTTIIVRLAALAVLGYMMWRRHPTAIPIERNAIAFWILLFSVPIVQLIPLPWSWWTVLPGHGLEKAIFDALGSRPAMPISLAPERTRDFALALIVPLSAYVTGTHLDYKGRTVIMRAILIVALLSAVVGLLQVSGGASSPLYFYSITNDDSSVGFFSNANHFSLFLSMAIVIALTWLGDNIAESGRVLSATSIFLGVAILALLFGIAGTGSRAGAIFSVIALIAGLLMLPLERAGVRRAQVIGWSTATLIALGLGLTLVLNGTLLSGRFRLEDGDERYGLLPMYGRITRDFFPFGSGLGSFEPVFKTYEQAQTLSFGYMNQAHNDFAQTAIEAGLAGILLIGVFLIWYVIKVVSIWRGAREPSYIKRQQIAAALMMALTITHSAVDYPMRTAAIATIFAFFAAFVVAPLGSNRKHPVSDRVIRRLAKSGQGSG